MTLTEIASLVTKLPSIVSLIELGTEKFSALAEVVVEEIAEAEQAYEDGATKLEKVLGVLQSFTEDWEENWDDLVGDLTALIDAIVAIANIFGIDLSKLSDLFGDEEE